MRILSAVLVGLVFGVGIAISGMINPAKVLNFFDIAGTWDPSLIFVMGGALLTTFIGYRLVLKRPGPIVEAEFKLPTNTMIDARLIGGSAVFGLGWGIAGFCPGAAVPALGSGRYEVLAFVAALLAGLWVAKMIQTKQADRRVTA
tara:strand:- start:780 stop:1214 length:435 start_codon:yes stop_codon:yes gene_type:complete